jgi:hypothetical protein
MQHKIIIFISRVLNVFSNGPQKNWINRYGFKGDWYGSRKPVKLTWGKLFEF